MNALQDFSCPYCGAQAPAGMPSSHRPLYCPNCGRALPAAPPGEITGRDVYNIASDIATGVNVRASDNLLQLKVMGIGLLAGAALGFAVGALAGPDDRLAAGAIGAAAGAVAGLMLGFFGSGVYLMIYRFLCHLKGRHD